MVHRHGFSLAAVAAATLVACGGGGSSSGANSTPAATSTSAYLDGTAAYGAPLAQARITITDANGKTVTVTASDTGSYKADVTGLKAPLLVTATADSGDTVRVYHALVSVDVAAGTTGRANVTLAADGAAGAASSTVATVKDATAAAPSPLPTPTVTDSITAFDPWVTSVNKCLALPPAQRVSVDTSGAPTAFLGDCAKVSGFTANYLHNGYTLLQYWGQQLHDAIPDGAVMGRPEVLGFFKNDAGDDTAIVRLTYRSPKGGGSYVETAHKVSGTWSLEGNQRKYDAGIAIRMARSTDVSTYPYTPSNGPDVGKSVGWFNAYSPRIHLQFNQSGPNGAAVYAVRVKGPGLPAGGIVLARSSACGTGDYLATYSNDGSLPTTPAAGTTVMPMPTGATSNRYTLGVAQNGSAYTGTDFYNEWRGRNADGTPSTAKGNMIAPSPGVDLATIPPLARYVFEVFEAGSSTPVATFAARAVTKPASAAFAAKLP
jgi:hypothetical protein